MDLLHAEIQGPAPRCHAAQPLYRAVFSRRGDRTGGGTSALLRVPAPGRTAVRGSLARGTWVADAAQSGGDGCRAAPAGVAKEEGHSTGLRGVAGLPDGVFVRGRHAAHLVVRGNLLAWTLEGYVPIGSPPHVEVEIITPPAIVAALSAGYRPMLHPTAARALESDAQHGMGERLLTRSSLRSTLRRSSWLLALVLAISLATKLAEHIPGIAGGPLEKLATDIYEYLKDMALLFVTVVAAYLASVFQKRTTSSRRCEKNGATSSRPSRRCLPTRRSRSQPSATTWQPSAPSPRRSTTCVRSTRTWVKPAGWSGSTLMNRCTICGARCKR